MRCVTNSSGGTRIAFADPRHRSASCHPPAVRTRRSASPSRSRQVPTQIEVLQAKAHRVHDLVARRADRVARGAASRRCRSEVTFMAAASLSRFVSTPGGGTGAGVPSRFSRIHLPRVTGEVRVATDVTVRMLPCPAGRGADCRPSGDAPEVAAADIRNAVMLRQSLVDERVVRIQQGHGRCGLRARRSRRASRFPCGRPGAGCRRNSLRDVSTSARSRRYSHCPAKLFTSAQDFGSASMRSTCCSSTFGSRRRAFAATSSSSSSGMLLHRKNDRRDARSRSLSR